MKWIGGDSGQPRRPVYFPVGHKAVLVDLNALYPQTPHYTGEYFPDGLQIRSVHLGVLTAWARSEWGEWYGKVSYTIAAKDREEKVTHWVPGWALRPADTAPSQQQRRGR
ncbi:hypothetical protein G3I13_23900 [Streptomyces sp. SID6673]|nr:hypothetical protein [Streptomyces sp. SID11726]NEB27392.1 hypothetical protein [Streptomyces sp. SID6673]